jgi:hypothetical protein
MRRIAVLPAIVVLVVGFGVGTALPAGAGALVETFPVSFTVSSANCSNLPDGTTITGSGIEKSITTFRTDGAGVTTTINATHAHGTATDQDLNVYVFDYSNEFRASNTVAEPDLISGLMTDHFSLSGSGPATLNNGFVASFTAAADFSSFSATPISSFGDPISFPDAAAHCDPL